MRRVAASVVSLVGVAVALLLATGGAGPAATVRAYFGIAVLQLLPGVLLWRALRPLTGWWAEDLVAGLTLGIPVAVTAQVVAGLSRMPALSTVLPLVLTGGLVAVPAVRRRVLSRRTVALPWWWALLAGLPALVTVQALRTYARSVPLSWPAGSRTPYVDMYAHLSLAAEIARRGPERFPWVGSEPLGYHWFSHAWVAHVAVVSHVPLDVVLLRLMPAAVPLWVALAAAVATLRLTGQAWSGPVAALLCLAGGRLAVGTVFDLGSPDSPFSPSLGLSAPTLLLLVVVLALRWRGELGRWTLLLVLVLGLTAAGTKGSTLPLVLSGLVLAIVALALLDRRSLPGLAGETAVLAVAMELAIHLVYRGSGGGLSLDPQVALAATEGAAEVGGTGTAGAGVLAVVLVAVGALARAAGLGPLLLSRVGRRDPLPWVLLGTGLAATGALLMLAQAGGSQGYFLSSAEPLLSVGSVVGLDTALRRTAAGMRALVVGGVGGVALRLASPAPWGPVQSLHSVGAALLVLLAGLAVLAVTLLVGVRVARSAAAVTAVVTVLVAGVTGVVVAQVRVAASPLPTATPTGSGGPATFGAVSRNQVDAARWIRDHSGPDDVVMTNRHCRGRGTPVRGCDSRWFVVAAFSERQVLVEGWTYTPRAASESPMRSITVPYWDPALLELNDSFILHPNASAARRLRELRVRWVFVDHSRPYAANLAPEAALRFHDADVDVWELRP